METPANPGGPAPEAHGRLAVGTTLRGRLVVERFDGATSLAELYHGSDTTDGRSVTIQLLHRDLVRDPAVRLRLQHDLELSTRLQHKNIASTLGFFIEDDHAVVVREPLDAATLRQMLQKKRESGHGFALKGAYNVVTHVCSALEYAHDSLIHGLLNLDTIHVNHAGRVKLTDFGLALALCGQPGFAGAVGAGQAALAPELFGPGEPGPQADLYSVGAILFELLVGRPRQHDDEQVSALLPGTPALLDAVIARCMSPHPDDRFADAHELRVAIHAATEAVLASAGPQAAGPAQRPLPPLPQSGFGPAQRPGSLPPFKVPPVQAGPAPPQAGPPSGPPLPALTAVDEAHERWIIQKDRLDLGPFKLADVKTQIEAGKVVGEHTIVDMENGQRMLVKDHPLLRDLVAHAAGLLQSRRELEQLEAERRASRRRTTWAVTLIGLTLIALGGATTAWLLTHKPKTELKIVYRDKEGTGADSWKLEVMMKVDPPVPKKKGVAHKHGKGSASEFDAVNNLGDATEAGGDETLDASVVQKVMNANFGLLKGCVFEEKRRSPAMTNVEFDFIIRGSGQVSAVRANGQSGSPLSECIHAKMQSVQFPHFNGSRTHASFSLALK